ncbi:sce7726 family protein [Sanguibacter sp. 25GB23B1]|uniref:sce7726 family protein n=1 Tax=unclassified Sanguibacter TaxID=2645534 RepID=UPI0032AF1D0D
MAEFSRGCPTDTLADAFDKAHAIESRAARREYYFKNLIVSRMIFGRHSPRTAAALLELRAGRSIADVVILNGTSTAYEIKTDFDDFTRLPAQISDYAKAFERVCVVVSSNRAQAAAAATPEWVGVTSVNRRGQMTEVRAARGGLARITHRSLFGLLHRSEVLEVLAQSAGYEIDAPPARLWSRTLDVFSSLPIQDVQQGAVAQLALRGKRAASLAGSVPHSLRALAYDVPVSGPTRERIIRRLEDKAESLLL